MSSLAGSPFYEDSSPESSPVIEPIDSSPPSSPSLVPVSLSPPVSPGPAHPFAASTKGVKPPRLYEKHEGRLEDDRILYNDHAWNTRPGKGWDASPRKNAGASYGHARTLSGTSTSSSVTETAFDRPTSPHKLLFGASYAPRRSTSPDSQDELADIYLSDDERPAVRFLHRKKSRLEREQDIWDEVITKAIDSADGVIELQQNGLISSGLSFIPPSISDLAALVVLPSRGDPPSRAGSGKQPQSLHRSITLPSQAPSVPFVHNHTAPLTKSSSLILRNTSHLSSPSPPSSVQEVKLFLGNNVITKLPMELFSLTSLTVLSMRNNLLTHIPAQIARLTNLRELNIAQNKLTYLPAEMLEMSLDILAVDGNPWISWSPPSAHDSTSHDVNPPVVAETSSRTSHRALRRSNPHPSSDNTEPPIPSVSKTDVHFWLPSLLESCFRVMFSPYRPTSEMSGNSSSARPSTSHPKTLLEAMFELPLPNSDQYPAHIVDTFRSCVPQAVAKPDRLMQASPMKRSRLGMTRSRVSSVQSDVFGPSLATGVEPENFEDQNGDERPHPGIGTCMSPVHPRDERPAFVRSAEERFVWVRTIAGQPVHEDVPVLWRGCSRGCLSFLGEEPPEAGQPAAGNSEPPAGHPAACASDDMDLDDNAGDDEATELEAIDLGGGFVDDFD
ncbi:hypothetical protein BDW22DRAFT_1428432 [Trametopsis cervina]|nr:hypothetical protein BDW22DRAFT_1428432 [Trametopsis cervina]